MRFPHREYTLADNFQLKVVAGCLDHFEKAMAIAWNNSKAEYYAITDAYGLVFFSWLSDSERRGLEKPIEYPVSIDPQNPSYDTYVIHRLPKKMSVGPGIEFALNWLYELKSEDYVRYAGERTDNWDIMYEWGVTISTGDCWNHVGTHSGAICYVKPTWMLLGK